MNRYGWDAYFKDILAPYLKMDIYRLWSQNMDFIFREMERMKWDDDVRYNEMKQQEREMKLNSMK